MRLVHFRRVRNTGEALPHDFGHSHLYVNPSAIIAINGGRQDRTTMIELSTGKNRVELVRGDVDMVARRLRRKRTSRNTTMFEQQMRHLARRIGQLRRRLVG